MKKVLIIKSEQEKIEKLSTKFTNYIPDENKYTKVATLNEIDYDYLYITDFKKTLLTSFKNLFTSNQNEDFHIDCNFFTEQELEIISIAFTYATYHFSKNSESEKNTSKISFSNDSNAITRGDIIARAMNYTKTIVNEPSNYLTTVTFTEKLEKLAADNNLKFTLIDKKQLVSDGAGGILAVNQSSVDEARIVKLEYVGDNNAAPYVLVGKGIVFDTGGYSLKPSKAMIGMKSDIGGAATVAGVIKALSELKAKINVTVFIPITDNLIGPNAYRPDDVIEFINGKTAEIISTDAEGRLILADALCYASKLKPKLIIDAATLTGAIGAALGAQTTGVFGNSDDEIKSLVELTNSLEEYAWHMPINDTHRESIKSKVATLKNAASPGGACTAAAFLENFVEDNKWIHLDIAYSSWIEKIGGSGAMVRPLVEYLVKMED